MQLHYCVIADVRRRAVRTVTPIIIGGLAFGAELGGWQLTKRQIQNAAGTAAFAAGTQVRSCMDETRVANAQAMAIASDRRRLSSLSSRRSCSPSSSACLKSAA